MGEYEDWMVRNLRNISEKESNKQYGFGETRWTDLCKDCANKIESLCNEIDELNKRIASLTNSNYQLIDERNQFLIKINSLEKDLKYYKNEVKSLTMEVDDWDSK